MSYVVGFLGNDGELGRTIQCHSLRQCESVVNKMIIDNDDEMYEDPDFWQDSVFSTTYQTSVGTYFIGQLEEEE